MALVGLYEHHGTERDLDQAIELQRTAVDQTPEGHPEGADRAGYLGLRLAKRADNIGSTQDIACSVDAIRASVKALPKDHAARPRLLMGLGSSLHSLSRRTSSVIDLKMQSRQQERQSPLSLGAITYTRPPYTICPSLLATEANTTRVLQEHKTVMKHNLATHMLRPSRYRDRQSTPQKKGILIDQVGSLTSAISLGSALYATLVKIWTTSIML
ncbi:hypothetical protein LA080_001082 [Diaporthe eres]|nr:hypothetical protein LA080_001082 [Diaporthe eres]